MNQSRWLGEGDSRCSGQGVVANSYFRLGLYVLINGVLCVLLILAAVLREMSEFWLNSGGYPVLLRECVFWLFYPGMIVCGMLTVAGTAESWLLLPCEPRKGLIFLVFCGLEMLALMAVVVIVL